MSEGRADRVVSRLAELDLDVLLVGDLVRPGDSGRDAGSNVRWLTGFSGTSGLAVVGADRRALVTDFRYTQRAEREAFGDFERVIAERELIPAAVELLRGRVGYDDAQTSVKNLRRLEEMAGEELELVPAAGVVEDLRRRKDDGELGAIAEAASLTDQVYEWVFERGVVGRSEREIMLAAHQRMRELGAEDPSFPAIVAAGENGAVPHHDSSGRKVQRDELLLIDMGAIVDGYCSDCTRTVATGDLGDDATGAYELVRSAQRSALDAIRAGVAARDADAAARDPITAAGLGDAFGHGLGHGVGLEVHESPRLGRTSDHTLEAGDVVSVEPGVYLPGRFGIRIEDLVTVTDQGLRNLSAFPKELVVVD
ncbi:MAG: M24 family metallopeptidase [Solirubrobacterales bacterium]